MRTLGVWLIIFAVASFLLPMLGMQLIILFWIYNWGPAIAATIQISMAALGAALLISSIMLARQRGPQA